MFDAMKVRTANMIQEFLCIGINYNILVYGVANSELFLQFIPKGVKYFQEKQVANVKQL